MISFHPTYNSIFYVTIIKLLIFNKLKDDTRTFQCQVNSVNYCVYVASVAKT